MKNHLTRNKYAQRLSSPLLQAGGFVFIGYLCAGASLLAVLIARFRLVEKPVCDTTLCMNQQNG